MFWDVFFVAILAVEDTHGDADGVGEGIDGIDGGLVATAWTYREGGDDDRGEERLEVRRACHESPISEALTSESTHDGSRHRFLVSLFILETRDAHRVLFAGSCGDTVSAI